MSTSQARYSGPSSDGSLPLDWRHWLPNEMTLRLVLAAVEQVDDRSLPSQVAGTDGQRHQSKALVALLTYCYGAQLYSSHQIEEKMQSDPSLRYLCGHSLPDSKTLMDFRRRNQTVLHTSLIAFFKLVWAVRFAQVQWKEIDWEVVEMLTHQDWYSPELTDRIDRTASLHLRRAIQTDSEELDD